VRIPVLQVGDEIKMNASPRPTTAFPLFLTAFLQRVAAARGISYEQLAMDWSKTNYSSARAALNEVWRTISRLFAQFSEQFLDPIRYCVIEEAFDRGYLAPPDGAPDFWELPAAYLNGRWIGPGRGYVDPTKEAEGANMRIDGLLSTLAGRGGNPGRRFRGVARSGRVRAGRAGHAQIGAQVDRRDRQGQRRRDYQRCRPGGPWRRARRRSRPHDDSASAYRRAAVR
jgi:capsid protein